MSCRASPLLTNAAIALVTIAIGCGRPPAVVNQTEWPLPMADLIAKYPNIVRSLTTYRCNDFVDSKFAWRIVGEDDEINRLIADLNLKQSTTAHTKFKELQQSIPKEWEFRESKATTIYVSDGYGDQHQEGTDLLLIARYPEVNETFVLYQWIF